MTSEQLKAQVVSALNFKLSSLLGEVEQVRASIQAFNHAAEQQTNGQQTDGQQKKTDRVSATLQKKWAAKKRKPMTTSAGLADLLRKELLEAGGPMKSMDLRKRCNMTESQFKSARAHLARHGMVTTAGRSLKATIDLVRVR